MGTRRVTIQFLGEDKSASKTARQVELSTSKVGAGAVAAGTLAATGLAAAGAAALKLGVDSVTAEASFSQTMNTMAAVANVPKNQMKSLSDLALKMGADTTFSAGEAADAMLELAKGGLSSATIQGGALQGTLTLAAAGGTDLATAATIASNALNTFGLKGKDMASVAAALAGGANASSASVESLGQALQQVGPGATNAGLSLQDTVGTLSAFDAAGIKGADAGTSLKTMLVSLVPHTNKARNAMHDLGLKFTDANGKFLPITNVAEQLKTKLSKLSQEQRTTALSTIFGSDATRAATVLMNQGADGLGKFIAATKDQNAAQSVAKARMAGTAGALESFKGSVETAKLQLGLFLAPAVQAGLGVMSKAVNGIVPGVKSLAASISTNLKPTMDQVVPKLKEFGEFAQQKILPALKNLGKYLFEVLAPIVKKFVTEGLKGAKDAFDRVKKALEDNQPQLKKLKDAIAEIVKWVAEKLGPIIGWLAKTQLQLLGQQIAGVITVIGKMVSAFSAIKKAAGDAVTAAWKAISGFFGDILTGAAKAFGWVPGLGGKLKTAAKDFETFKNNVNTKLAKINDEPVDIKVGLAYTQALGAKTKQMKFAGGGKLHGPGTTTSDSIPILGSRKEWVIKAKSSEKYGDHAMASVNAGTATIIPGFADGGRPGLALRNQFPSTGRLAALTGAAAGDVDDVGSAIAKSIGKQLATQLAGSGPAGPAGTVQGFRGVKLNARTISMVQAAERILGSAFRITQGSYSTSVAASGSTHSGGGAMDTNGPGGWGTAQAALRKVGFAAWHRTPAMGPWGHHIHSIAIGDSTASPAAKRQVADFLRGGDGLGSYQNGTDFVPETGLYRLHKGEKVTPAAVNSGELGTVRFELTLDGKVIQTKLLRLKKLNGGLALGLA